MTPAARAVRCRRVATAATAAQWVALAVAMVGLLAHLGHLADRWQVLLPAALLLGLPAFVVSLCAVHLADRYREAAEAAR